MKAYKRYSGAWPAECMYCYSTLNDVNESRKKCCEPVTSHWQSTGNL